jgi:ketosteroid isomerase-like protein
MALWLSVATAASAQSWSPAEREVLAAIDNCLQAGKAKNLEADLACTHDDFLGWSNDMPALRDKALIRAQAAIDYAARDLIAWSIQPLGIRIIGNVAVVHYYGYYLFRDKAGKDLPVRSRWTDIMTKQGNRWVWIADHGGSDPGTKPIDNQ